MGLQRYLMCFIGWIDSFLNVKPMSLSGTIFQESWQLLNGSIFWKLLCSRQFDGWFRNLSINWQSGYFAFYRIVKEICHFSKWIYHHVRKEGKWYFPKEYGQKDIDGLKYCRSLKIMKIFSTSMGSVNHTILKKVKIFFSFSAFWVKSAFGNSMKGILQIHHELLYNCKASGAKTFQNFITLLKMQILIIARNETNCKLFKVVVWLWNMLTFWRGTQLQIRQAL